MLTLRKLIATSGLVILTSPLSFMAYGQGYIDVEAERAAAAAAGRAPTQEPVSTDPYGAQPAKAYPATSFGTSSSTTVPAGGSSGGGTTGSPTAATNANTATSTTAASGGSNLGNLFYQIQQLQQEVMRLNGKVEEQTHEISQLREQSLQRYMDLDKRLSAGAVAPVGASATGGSNGDSASSAQPAQTTIIAPGPDRSAAANPGMEQAGEGDAYRGAYALVQGRQFDQAIPAFEQFLRNYPGGKYAANAHYWLGELYLVVEPRDLEAARQSFALLLSEYPENSKAPDALYKLGKVQFEKGNREKAREYLDLVIRSYSSTNPAVVKLAREFISENY